MYFHATLLFITDFLPVSRLHCGSRESLKSVAEAQRTSRITVLTKNMIIKNEYDAVKIF